MVLTTVLVSYDFYYKNVYDQQIVFIAHVPIYIVSKFTTSLHKIKLTIRIIYM